LARSVIIVGVAVVLLLLPALSADASTGVNSSTVAGYQVTGPVGSIPRIKGSWVVPTLNCKATPNANLSISVMLDGMGTTDRMQIGTVAACVSGVATYRVFEVMAPLKGKMVVPSLTISAGDKIEAQGKWSPQTHGWHDQIIDETTGVTKAGYAKSPSSFTPPLNSGSFIVSNNGVSALADFGQVGFGSANTNVKQTCIVTAVLSGGTTDRVITLGALATQTGFTLNQITMVDLGNSPMATTGALASDGESFTVTWVASS
jgi:hypothetical protein